jgi:hypothetical protein
MKGLLIRAPIGCLTGALAGVGYWMTFDAGGWLALPGLVLFTIGAFATIVWMLDYLDYWGKL